VPSDPAVVGCLPRPRGANGSDDRVEGVAPAVAHDDAAVCPRDTNVSCQLLSSALPGPRMIDWRQAHRDPALLHGHMVVTPRFFTSKAVDQIQIESLGSLTALPGIDGRFKYAMQLFYFIEPPRHLCRY
jgi:hypothetical protein